MRSPFGGQISVDEFMRDVWQKRPLILENAVDPSRFKVDVEEIVPMAYSLSFDSRLITGDAKTQPLKLLSGPLYEEDLEDFLGKPYWTLLIQDTEQELPQMHQLLELFRFIPNWRLDDVQLSYASRGGSVGPHVDSYDVFLVQISGERHWKIERTPVTRDRQMREDTDLKLLQKLDPDTEFVARPGDLIYLPPNIPHWGIAVDECVTASIGFRIPQVDTLLSLFSEMAIHLERTVITFVDSVQERTNDPGRVSDAPLDWFQSEMRQIAEDRNLLERLYCRTMSCPVRGHGPLFLDTAPSLDVIREDLEVGITLSRYSPAMMVYREFEDCVRVYALADEYELKKEMKPFAQLLTGTEELNYDTLKPYLQDQVAMSLIQDLLKTGCLFGS